MEVYKIEGTLKEKWIVTIWIEQIGINAFRCNFISGLSNV